MNYFILPKNNINVSINPQQSNNKDTADISSSVFNQLQLMNIQLTKTCEDKLNYMCEMINPMEFLYTNVPGTLLSVSKVKPDSNIFFELMEIFQMLNLTELFNQLDTHDLSRLNIGHVTHNSESTTYLLNMLREDNNDNVIVCNLNSDYIRTNNEDNSKMDVIICDFKNEVYSDTIQYTNHMILLLHFLLKKQTNKGISIIKIDHLFNKCILDVLYILSGLYEKICIVKPITSNAISNERFIVCKGFSNMENMLPNIETIAYDILDGKINYLIHSILNSQIPYYFVNKIEEINAVLGQQQLETISQIINIMISKNKDDKIENMKRTNIQKCIQWCEKYKLPHNKFIDKINIFLSEKKPSSPQQHQEDEPESELDLESSRTSMEFELETFDNLGI